MADAVDTPDAAAPSLLTAQEVEVDAHLTGDGDASGGEAAAVTAQYEAECERARARAERFGVEYKAPPMPTALLPLASVSDAAATTQPRRRHRPTADAQPREPGAVTGWDVTTEKEASRRSTRAARFNIPVTSYAGAPMREAGLGEREVAVRAARRARAERFGVPDELDVAIARAALEALGAAPQEGAVVVTATPDVAATGDVAVEGADAPSAAAVAGAPPALRPDALHLRVFQYLPAATRDVMTYFDEAGVRPSTVEWLNGCSVNVCFADAGSARRALELLAEPVPVVPGIDRVAPAWRVAYKPLVKLTTDRYAPAGTETTLYLRPATAADAKERAFRTKGAGTFGTFGATPFDEVAAALPLGQGPSAASYVAGTLRRAAEGVSGSGGGEAAQATEGGRVAGRKRGRGAAADADSERESSKRISRSGGGGGAADGPASLQVAVAFKGRGKRTFTFTGARAAVAPARAAATAAPVASVPEPAASTSSPAAPSAVAAVDVAAATTAAFVGTAAMVSDADL